MCRKVVLTKAQAEEFESFKKLRNGLEEWARDKYDPNAPNSVIHNMTFDEVAHAYYIGYEIEPEQPKFQPGDKVKKANGDPFPCGGIIRDVTGIYENWFICDNESRINPVKYREIELRHATPEEIYWLHELGRYKVGDFREGDVIITQEVSYRYSTDGEVDTIGSHTTQLWLDEGIIKGIYPAESFKPFPKEQGNEHDQ